MQLAKTICEKWDWHQKNGALSITACRDLLLKLHDWGHITLPPHQQKRISKKRSLPVLPTELIPLSWVKVDDNTADLDSLLVRPITPEERQGWGIYMQRYHYLGYRTIVGEHILYAAFLQNLDEMVALIGWASPAFRAPLREEYIGWDEQAKRKRLQMVVNNVRFLVPPWVRVKNLASKVLAYNLKRLSSDWQRVWGHPVYLAETFVNQEKFRGTCYRAANWIYLGQTAGRSKRGNDYLKNSTPKSLYVYPLGAFQKSRLILKS